MYQERMLNSSSSSSSSSISSSSSSFSSSSSSLISANDLHRSSISASSSSSSYNPIPFDHHPQQPLPLHPTLQSPHPHYYHLHHLHAQYASVDSPHHLHPYPRIDSTHQAYPFPRASITTGSIDNSRLSGDLYERLSNHNHTKDSRCQAHISKSVINTNESSINHGYSVASRCNTTDCSPRSVIRHGQPSSSAPGTDPRWLSSYYTNFSTNGGTSPATACPHQAPELSMTRPHHPSLHETNQGAFLHVHMQSDALGHHQMPSPWRSPSAIHHHCYDVCSSFNMPSPHSGHNNYKAGTEKVYKGGGMRKNPKALERGSSRSADLHKQREIERRKSGYFSGSAVEDKPCMISSNDSRAGYGSIKQRKQTGMALRTEQGNFNVSVNKCTAAKPMYISMPTSMQTDHGHKVLQKERSFSCDLHNSKQDTTSATPTRCTGGMQQAGCVNFYKMDEVASRSPDALLNYSDRVANKDSNGNAKGRAQLGSKWEDAGKWVRPPNYDQHSLGCRGFSNLGLLRMSNCVNAETAVKSQHIHLSNGLVPPAILSSHDCISNYSSDFSASARTNYRSSGSESSRLYAAPESIMPTHARPFPPCPQFAANQHIEEQVKQRTDDKHNLQESYTQKARQKHCASSSESGSNMAPPKLARDNHIVASPPCGLGSQVSNEEGSACGSDWNVNPLPHYPYPSHQLMTDRFASGEIMSCATTSYAGHNDENASIMPTMQGNVPMSMVSLREVGTQMSSIDGSGSISRFTSKNGSPQKPISPTRHNTPAYMRSLNGSTNSISNLREGGKKAIDLEELVECHRAKLELQALSEGERIHSFHRTISNWSSREMEEADLSRSLRHSANLDEDQTSKDHPWPSQSFSWDKYEDSKLAKLLIKEARIQAWEDKKRSKAEAQLKRLEESLAKKRSQTTNKNMGNLGAAQKKAEEMRASVCARQRGATQKAHRFRHRSLSPLSRCICFSTLE